MTKGIRRPFPTRLRSIRFEDGPWPLWRVDQGFRYGLKSLWPVTSTSSETRRHFEGMARYHQGLQKRLTGTAIDKDPLQLAAVGDLMWIPKGWSTPLSLRMRQRLQDADLRIANLETPVDPLSPVPRWTYASFNAPLPFLDPWRDGPTVLSLCNNHALDQGLAGLQRTRQRLEECKLTAVGGCDADASVQQLTVQGYRIAVIGSTYGINPWGPHSDGITKPPVGVPQIAFGSLRRKTNWQQVEVLLAKAHASHPDLVVWLPHWGFEFETWPELPQRQAAYRLVKWALTSYWVLRPMCFSHWKWCPSMAGIRRAQFSCVVPAQGPAQRSSPTRWEISSAPCQPSHATPERW